jgi:ABC-type polysaccharide/polyol phosphate export permease
MPGMQFLFLDSDAAFVYVRVFDFTLKPGALSFIAYLAVGIPLIFVFRKLRTGAWN